MDTVRYPIRFKHTVQSRGLGILRQPSVSPIEFLPTEVPESLVPPSPPKTSLKLDNLPLTPIDKLSNGFAPPSDLQGKLHVFIMSWEGADPSIFSDAECTTLADVFHQHFGARIYICKLKMRETDDEFGKSFEDFATRVEPDDTAIIYYTGHGEVAMYKGFMLVAARG